MASKKAVNFATGMENEIELFKERRLKALIAAIIPGHPLLGSYLARATRPVCVPACDEGRQATHRQMINRARAIARARGTRCVRYAFAYSSPSQFKFLLHCVICTILLLANFTLIFSSPSIVV